jgi:hypothetical protein
MGLPPVLTQRFPVPCFMVCVGMQRLAPLEEALDFGVGENSPMALAQRSKLLSFCFPAGRPASIHAQISETQADTSLARWSRTQSSSGPCLKVSRSSGRSSCGSRRIGMTRRAISLERAILLPMAIHEASFGTLNIFDAPRMRPRQTVAVKTALNAAEFRVFKLSIRIHDAPLIRSVVIFFSCSALSLVSAMTCAARLVAMRHATSASSPFPEPCVDASMAKTGDLLWISGFTNGSRRSARIFA